MPYRSVLTTAQLDALLACPQTEEELAALYAFDARDRAFIRQHRGDHNRLGVAVQLCYLRYPGHALAPDSAPEPALLAFVAREVRVSPAVWADYARRDETRREHALAVQKTYGYVPFTTRVYRRQRALLTALALQTNKAAAIAQQFVETLRREAIIVPPAGVIDRLCAEALARGTRLFYQRLSAGLDPDQRRCLDRLLTPREDARTILLTWLRQPPGEAKARNILTHLDRLQALRAVGVPSDLAHMVHQTRLTQLAREGAQMSIQHLRDLEETRRHATLVALVLDTQATVIDQVLDMHDKVIGKLFTEAKRTHAATFADQGKAINEKVRQYSDVGQAVISARERGADPYAAIEAVLPWDRFTHSVAEAAQLARPASFDHLQFLTDGCIAMRRASWRVSPSGRRPLPKRSSLRVTRYAACMRAMPGRCPRTRRRPSSSRAGRPTC